MICIYCIFIHEQHNYLYLYNCFKNHSSVLAQCTGITLTLIQHGLLCVPISNKLTSPVTLYNVHVHTVRTYVPQYSWCQVPRKKMPLNWVDASSMSQHWYVCLLVYVCTVCSYVPLGLVCMCVPTHGGRKVFITIIVKVVWEQQVRLFVNHGPHWK